MLKVKGRKVLLKLIEDVRSSGVVKLPNCVHVLHRCAVVDAGDEVRDVRVGDIVYVSYYPMRFIEEGGVQYAVVYEGDILLKEVSGVLLEVLGYGD